MATATTPDLPKLLQSIDSTNSGYYMGHGKQCCTTGVLSQASPVQLVNFERHAQDVLGLLVEAHWCSGRGAA